MKTHKHLVLFITLLTAILGLITPLKVEAATRTINIQIAGYGEYRYRYQTSGEYGTWSDYTTSSTSNLKIEDNQALQIESRGQTDDDKFLCWTNSSNDKVPGEANPTFTISGDQTYKVHYLRCWSVTNASGTKTYTLTSPDPSKSEFKVNNGATIYSAIGDIGVTGGDVTINFDTQKTVHLNGCITLNGGTLTLNKTREYTGSTLKRYNRAYVEEGPPYVRKVWYEYKGGFIVVKNTTSTLTSKCQLVLKGYRSGATVSRFFLNGGCDGYGIVWDGSSGAWNDGNPSADVDQNTAAGNKPQTSRIKAQSALLDIRGGKVTVEDVNFTANWNENSTSANGGAILVGTDSDTRSESKVEITHCSISKCYAKDSGGAMYIYTILKGDNRNSSVTMTDCTIEKCFTAAVASAAGGTIRTMGASYCTLEMEDCTVKNNCSNAASGGLSWNAGRVPALELTNCTLQENWTLGEGGGLSLNCAATIKGCKFKNNTSKVRGGGIYYSMYSSSTYVADYHPYDGDLSFDASTEISGNYAPNGGGMYILIRPIKVGDDIIYNNINGQPYSVNLSLNGATISGNTADDNGGGIWLQRNTDIYTTNINLNYGEISGNKANGSGSNGLGGGVFVDSSLDGDKIPVTIGGSLSGTMTIKGNTAYRKGGGLYVNRGDVTISGGIIGASGEPNIATTGEGGALFMTSTTSVNFIGGTLQYNQAATNGGGIYKLGSLSVSSTPIIKRNTANGVVSNVFIPSDASEKYVNISGNLTSGALIGITKTTTDHAYSGYGGYYTDIASASTADIAATGIRRFYDDTQTCGVYSDYNSRSYSNPSSTSLYFVKYSTTEPTSWLNYTSSTWENYTEVGTTVTVKSAAGMAYFASQVLAGNDYAGKTVNLDTDISLTGHNWVPVGYCMGGGETPQSFAGTFDGQGHTISGLSCSSSYPTVGLFGHVTGVVDNVLLGATITGSSATNLGGIAGIVGSGGAIRNSMAFVILEGGGSSTTMGSLVGSIETGGSLKNSFAKVISFESGSTVGGLVGNNAGTLQNCYVINSNSYAANNTGTLENCYYGPIDPPLTSSGTNGTFTAASTTYNYGSDYNMESVTGKPLYQALNHWAEDNGISTYSRWMRMPTTDINGGYPLFDFFLYDCVASTDNMPHYSDGFNDLFGTYVAANDGAGEGTIYLFNTPALIDGTGNVNVSNNGTATNLFIQEDVALKPTTGSKDAGDIIATTGVTLKNLQSSDDSWDWHMFSSALKDVPLGINYKNLDEFGYGEAPTPVTDFEFLNTGYFPTVAANAETYREIDYYSYDEPSYHWINLKRNPSSHWDQYSGLNIPYTGESTMTSGKGYLMAMKQETLLQATGTLNNGEVSIAVTKLGEYRTGCNFLGNPYQSYLDFDAFAAYTDATHDNRDLWEKADEADEHGSVSNASYIILDKDGYHSYAYDQSNNTFAPNQYLHPHQGFMIIVKGDATKAAFANSMRNTTATADFRDERPNYPLVNLIVTEADGARDLTTVELGRPDKGGALKAYDLHKGKGCLYTHYEDEDWAIAFTQPGISEVGVRFEADEAATFTMTWDMENGEFHYLHLIDNMAGTDIDCLSATEYRFTATPDDYKSRFRLVFGYTGIEEPETDEPAEGTSAFAFQMGNELVVNGEGQLEIIDMMGRTVRTAQLQGSQSTMPMPRCAAGVYVLRLTDKGVTRVQKIVVD